MRCARYLIAVFVALSFAAGCGYALWFVTQPIPPPSAELSTPMLSMAHLSPLSAKPLFFTLQALPYLKDHWQEWSPAFGTSSLLPEEFAVQFDPTTQSPKEWRVLDRKWHFGAVLLTGDPSNFRPLLNHLRNSPDWTLTQMDPTSLLFERSPAKAWTPADVSALIDVFQSHSAEEQENARILIAHRLMFLDEIPAAHTLLEEVVKTNPKSSLGWTEMASLQGMKGQWQESLTCALRALEVDAHYRAAQFSQANALYALGRFPAALGVTRDLYAETPTDGQALFLHAKVTHAAHAYQEEVEVLSSIIALNQSMSQPVGLWQVYLGQAYAALGDGEAAQDQFNSALQDPTVGGEERAFAQKALERFAPKTDFLKSTPSLPKSSLLDGLPDPL